MRYVYPSMYQTEKLLCVFYRITRRNIIVIKINNINKEINIFCIKQKKFRLLGLTDNLFDVISKNISLIQDNIIGKANEASPEEIDKY